MLKTKELEKQGITITICDDVNGFRFRDCDVVHMFNIQELIIPGGIEQCKRAKKKAALSTISGYGECLYVSMLYKALRLKPSPFAPRLR